VLANYRRTSAGALLGRAARPAGTPQLDLSWRGESAARRLFGCLRRAWRSRACGRGSIASAIVRRHHERWSVMGITSERCL